jgi:uncharacterized protein YbaR (Trm112 family)
MHRETDLAARQICLPTRLRLFYGVPAHAHFERAGAFVWKFLTFSDGSRMAHTLDPGLMEIMVCPESHARLIQVGDWLYSTDPATRRRYPVREGLPIMLIEESEVVNEADFQKVMQQNQEKVTR